MTTLSILARHDAALAADAGRVLRWTLANLRRRDGRFAFQRHRLWRNTVPYIRWSDGTEVYLDDLEADTFVAVPHPATEAGEVVDDGLMG